jgi:hypothetical protein
MTGLSKIRLYYGSIAEYQHCPTFSGSLLYCNLTKFVNHFMGYMENSTVL